MRRRTATNLTCGGVLAIALLVIGIDWSVRRDGELNLKSGTLSIIGNLALKYLAEQGEAPRSVDDLVQAGYLRWDHGQLWLYDGGGQPLGTWSDQYVWEVALTIPTTGTGVGLDGHMVDPSTQVSLTLVSMPKERTRAWELRRINDSLSAEWRNIMTNLATTRASSSPTSDD